MSNVANEVWQTVEALNQCWTSGNPADVRNYFHETMVAITVSDRMPLVGREACAAAWIAYAERTRILSWKTSSVHVQVYNHTAVVTYLYDMLCERDGMQFNPTGRDMAILIKENGRWWVVADQFSAHPEVEGY
ncbi:MAG TPA: nuclear transport factor 2 family protein [Acidobacteriota bacterium]|nr:nuclear transport factor 2 family protein [Acidobacteriota bacterium]